MGLGWLSLVTFAALVLFHGMLVAALVGAGSAARSRCSPPRPRRSPTSRCCCCSRQAVALVAAVVGAVAVLASQVPAVVAAWYDERALTAGRAVLAVAALVAIPGFASAAVSILGRP